MSGTTAPLLHCQALAVTVPGRQLVDDLDFAVARGELVAVLGQNGTGKSLTLQTLAGLRSPARGRVILDAADIFARPRHEVARRLALLPQVIEDIFPATVLDTALIGRHPHIGRLGWESADDYAAVIAAMRASGASV